MKQLCEEQQKLTGLLNIKTDGYCVLYMYFLIYMYMAVGHL